MNCCAKPPLSPSNTNIVTSSSMAVSTRFDIEFDGYDGFGNSSFVIADEDDRRQEEEIMDALDIVLSNQSSREKDEQQQQQENKQPFYPPKQPKQKLQPLQVQPQKQASRQRETAGKHNKPCNLKSSPVSTPSHKTQKTDHTEDTESFTTTSACSSSTSESMLNETKYREPATPRHAAKISMFQSPSHAREVVEMELEAVTSCAKAVMGNLALSPLDDSFSDAVVFNNNVDVDCQVDVVDKDRKAKLSCAVAPLASSKEEERVTHEQWKVAQRELEENRYQLETVREKAKIIKSQLKTFHREWEGTQTLLRNKDKELERLRLIIAERTLQLTEKTGELSITKVSFVAAENGLTACKRQLRNQSEELEKTQASNIELKRLLSDTKAELCRTKLQLEASTKKRKQFSNRAMRILTSSDSDGESGEEEAGSASSPTNTGRGRLHNRSKSWSLAVSSSSADASDFGASRLVNTLIDYSMLPSFGSSVPSVPGTSTNEVSIQTSFDKSESAKRNDSDSTCDTSFASAGSKETRDHAMSKPTRSRSMKEDSRQDSTEEGEATFITSTNTGTTEALYIDGTPTYKDAKSSDTSSSASNSNMTSPSSAGSFETTEGSLCREESKNTTDTFERTGSDVSYLSSQPPSEQDSAATATSEEPTTVSDDKTAVSAEEKTLLRKSPASPLIRSTVTGSIMVIGWAILWGMVSSMENNKLGVTLVEGHLYMEDSRTIVSSLSLCALLSLMSTWMLVEKSWTAVYARLLPSRVQVPCHGSNEQQ